MSSESCLSLFTGWFLGILSSLLTSITIIYLGSRRDLLNKLTKEFQVKINEAKPISINGEIDKVVLKYSFIAKSDSIVNVDRLYIMVPKEIKNNLDSKSNLKDIFEGFGRHYIISETIEVCRSLYSSYDVIDKDILQAVREKRLSELQIFAITSKYGTVKSDPCKL